MNNITTKLTDLRKPPMVDIDVGIITDLINRHGMRPAPAKTELHGDWFQVVVPISIDHVAYLTLPDEAVDEIKKIMGLI